MQPGRSAGHVWDDCSAMREVGDLHERAQMRTDRFRRLPCGHGTQTTCKYTWHMHGTGALFPCAHCLTSIKPSTIVLYSSILRVLARSMLGCKRSTCETLCPCLYGVLSGPYSDAASVQLYRPYNYTTHTRTHTHTHTERHPSSQHHDAEKAKHMHVPLWGDTSMRDLCCRDLGAEPGHVFS